MANDTGSMTSRGISDLTSVTIITGQAIHRNRRDRMVWHCYMLDTQRRVAGKTGRCTTSSNCRGYR